MYLIINIYMCLYFYGRVKVCYFDGVSLKCFICLCVYKFEIIYYLNIQRERVYLWFIYSCILG